MDSTNSESWVSLVAADRARTALANRLVTQNQSPGSGLEGVSEVGITFFELSGRHL